MRLVPCENTSLFRNLPYGALFIVKGEPEKIWCKTPKADMYEYNNRYSADGAYCTAVQVGNEPETYMQCGLGTVCIELALERNSFTIKKKGLIAYIRKTMEEANRRSMVSSTSDAWSETFPWDDTFLSEFIDLIAQQAKSGKDTFLSMILSVLPQLDKEQVAEYISSEEDVWENLTN